MVDILAYQLANFFGAVAAILLATVAPYFQKKSQEQTLSLTKNLQLQQQ